MEVGNEVHLNSKNISINMTTNALVALPLTIPADPWLASKVQEFYNKAVKDIETDTEDTAIEAGLAYRKIVTSLLPRELSEINRTWSALNLEPNETRASNFAYTCEAVTRRASAPSSF